MASLRKKSGHYYARWYARERSPQRVERSLGCTRADVARRKLSRLEDEYHAGRYDPWADDEAPGSLSYSDSVTRFLRTKEHLRPKTQKAYRVALRTIDLPAGIRLADVGPDHLEHYVRDDSSVAVATRRKRHRHLKAFFRWAVKAGHLHRSPLDEVDPPRAQKKNPEYLTPEQLERILLAIDADFEMKVANDRAQPGQIQWLKDLITLAVNTGMRLRECTGLTWGAVDLGSGFVDVVSTEDNPTKSGHERRIPVTKDVRAMLERLGDERDGTGPGEPVLKGYTGGPLNASYASKRFKHYVRLAKLDEKFSFHSLRHTCASWLVQRGVGLPIVQAVLGHSDSSVTERYAHMAPDAMKQAMSVLDE